MHTSRRIIAGTTIYVLCETFFNVSREKCLYIKIFLRRTSESKPQPYTYELNCTLKEKI